MPILVDVEVFSHVSAGLSESRGWSGALLALGTPWVVAALLLVVLLLVLGVVYPAVWSRCPERRSAAQRVLSRLLRAFFPKKG